MTQLSQIGILPVLLIALGGLLVLRSAEPEKAQQRFSKNEWIYLRQPKGV